MSHWADAGGRPGGPSSLIPTSQVAARIEREQPGAPGAGGPIRFRLPQGADIKSMLAAGKVPEDKLKESIATALTRMQKEGRLSSKDPIADIMKRLFPSKGTLDEAELAKVIDVTDRNKIYKSVADAQTKVSSTDKPKLSAVIDDAVKLVDKAIGDATGLKQVFGTKDAAAKAIYQKAKTKLTTVKGSMDTMVHTDYNRDDEEIGLGGWASRNLQQIHLQRKVAEVADKDEAIITMIHECCHLAGPVDDEGYYGSAGFEAVDEDTKLGNAAHYEELPRRAMGKSLYAGLEFKPGVMKSGAAATFEDEVRREASELLRKAWDKAVDVHLFLRDIRQDIEKGSTASFKAKEARIVELSKLEKLTIHHQTPPSTINLNDIVLCEGVARATIHIKKAAKTQAVPAAPAVGKTKKDYVDQVVEGSIKSYGALTGNDADDKKLMDWLIKEYGKPL
jgi:hypothetical protein